MSLGPLKILFGFPKFIEFVGAFFNELPKSILVIELFPLFVINNRHVPLSLIGENPLGWLQFPIFPRFVPVGLVLKFEPKLKLVNVPSQKFVVKPYQFVPSLKT